MFRYKKLVAEHLPKGIVDDVSNASVREQVLVLAGTVNELTRNLSESRKNGDERLAKLEATLERSIERIGNVVDVKYSSLDERFSAANSRENDNRKFIIQISIALAGILTTMGLAGCTLLFFVISTTAESRLSPVREQAATAEANIRTLEAEAARINEQVSASSGSDRESKTDRAGLNTNVSRLLQDSAQESSERKRQVSEISARLLEQETQFKAVNTVLNMTRHELEVVKARLYGVEVPSRKYPEITPFYPELYQSAPKPIGGTDEK